MLNSKVSLDWPSSAPDETPVREKLLYLELPSGAWGVKAKRCVSVVRCKRCLNPHDCDIRPRYLSAEFTEYFLSSV